MQELYKSGRYFFAIALIAFGIIQFVTGNFMNSFLPVFENLPGRRFFLYLISTVFLVGGLAIFPLSSSRQTRPAYRIFIFDAFIYPHLIKLIPNLPSSSVAWGCLGWLPSWQSNVPARLA